MDNKILEIFIPGPAGRLEAKYYKSKKNTSPIALVLQPHPQYGGTMNNKVVVDTFHTFMDNDFSVCRVNFRGVGKSDGEFDNGQGELADAAAALDWLERENFDNSQCWVSGFSFGSLIAMQLLMRRPEINRFIAISPQPNVYDFSFLSPCPTSGLMIYGKKDELVPLEYITDLDKISVIADKAKIPLIVDNTSATPYLCRPIEHGATLVVHSTTKYLTGNGTVTGGCVVDSGKFDWASSDKFPSLSKPEPAYHGLKFSETFGPLAFTFFGIAVSLRDLGMTMNPQAAHYTLCGIETLSLRMDRHVENAKKVAEWLENDPRIDFVSYAGLKSSPYYSRVRKICPRGAGGLFTFGVKGGYEACIKLVDSLEIFSHVANLGDARSLIIHSASTTHRQLTKEQQEAAGAAPNTVRVSIGIESLDDLLTDLDQALKKAAS